jgi:predicted dehydrogenase
MQRVIIVGFGFMGGVHAQAYARIPGAKLVAIVDALPERAREQAAKISVEVPIFATLAEALAEVEADAVDICLPTDLHLEAITAAVTAKKHVFCEKPLAGSLDHARRIRAVVKKSKSRFMVGHCLRFWPEYQAFERFVREKRAGKLLSLTMQRRSARPTHSAGDWINKPKRSLGAALDMHIHDVDYLVHLLGTPKAVFATATRDFAGYSHIFTSYVYKGVCVQAEGGWNYPAPWGFQMAFQAVFENGTVEFDSSWQQTIRFSIGGDKAQPLPFDVPGAGESTSGSGNISSLGGYYNELAYFIDCLESGTKPKISTLEQAAESLRVVLAEHKSAEAGRVVTL